MFVKCFFKKVTKKEQGIYFYIPCSVKSVTANALTKLHWGIPAHFIMSIDEYAKKVVKLEEKLPWIKSGEYKDISEQELIKKRQNYYLKSILEEYL